MLLFSLINAHGMKKGQVHTSNGFASVVTPICKCFYYLYMFSLFVHGFTACKLFNCL